MTLNGMTEMTGQVRRTPMVAVLGLMVLAGCQGQEITDKKNTDWYHARAKILYGVAKERFSAGQLDHAQNRLQEALALNEDLTPAKLLLGKVYIERDQYSEAKELLSELSEEMPESAEVLYLLGVAQERCGNLPEALASYRRSYALDTTDLSPVMAAAEVLVGLGRLREAQLYIESYLQVAGTEPGMYELAGRLASMRNEYAKAADYYEQARDLDFENVNYLEALARAQFFAERYDEAVDSLQALIDHKEYEAPAWVYAMLGDSYMAMHRPRDAREAYVRATDMEPSSPGVWSNLAKAALASNDADRAVLSARQSLQLDPGQLDSKLIMGYALIRSRQTERAVRFLTEAVPMHPENATLRCLLGMALSAIGEQGQAVECYSRALQLEPESGLARELLAEADGRARH